MAPAVVAWSLLAGHGGVVLGLAVVVVPSGHIRTPLWACDFAKRVNEDEAGESTLNVLQASVFSD
jgi:hypothetical protein